MTDPIESNPPGAPEDYYRQLCERAAIALVATDARLRIVCWNAAASRLLGRSAEEMVGRPLEEAVPPERRKLLHRLVDRTLGRGETSNFEVTLTTPAGKERRLMAILSPIPQGDGQAQGLAVWVVDQTQRQRMTERLAQAEKMASLGTLASGVAHHFNNILGGVATFVDFALTSGDMAAMKRALQMAAEASSRASRITQSLLCFAERDIRQSDLADLTEVVLTFVHLVERPLGEKNIKLKLDLCPVPIVAVEANRMHQALGNLLTNAEEAMPGGGVVEIGLRDAGDEVALTFSDTGVGIPPQDLPLVFEPFFTTKGLLAGGDKVNPGLGLSVVHGIILEMGGRIEAQSTVGAGTTFTIFFPVKK